jgi:hypothetical protein
MLHNGYMSEVCELSFHTKLDAHAIVISYQALVQIKRVANGKKGKERRDRILCQ